MKEKKYSPKVETFNDDRIRARAAKKPAKPVAPPFINKAGDFDVRGASAWQHKKLAPRWFHKSKRSETVDEGKGKKEEWFSKTYERPASDRRLKGKAVIKRTKRLRVAALKMRNENS